MMTQAWRALSALCVGFFMILLDQSIVSVATPAIQEELQASYSQAMWVHSVYLLTFAVPLLVMGRLGDRCGPRRVYLCGLVLFTASSVVCGLAPGIEVLIAGRATQGVGGAMMAPQTMVVINRVFPRDKRGAALGVWGAVAGLSNLLGPLLGGVITQLASWQWIFLINVPLGLVTLALVLRWVPNLETTQSRIDGPSIVLSIVGISCVVFSIQERAHVWLLAAGLVLAVMFIRRQARLSETALLPVGLFRRRHFSFGNVSIFAMGFTIAGMMVPVMMYLQDVQHVSPLAAGLMVTPMSIIAGVLAPYVGRLVDRQDPRPVSMAGFLMMAVGVAMLVFCLRPEVSAWWVTGAMVVLGFGNACVWSPNSTLTLRDLPGEVAGAGSGMYNFMRQLGAVTGTAVLAAVLQARVDMGSAAAFAESLVPALVMLCVGLWAASRAKEQ
ncbi:MFS transporter [Corynebacterium sp. 320]|uniref:MFS transporter n=1 Tax=Corynebacterium TaxID=1716 RepID=UPI00125CBCC5|nr:MULTISPECIES: MFS transporter [Corynebacterium]KAB1503910.1 MFS transporter [Corynebacterium sp. 320]KAB1552991.1 MFS transporter [Corynebacterium sp. 321]KAB1553789.1 MFS transporter [Corynebacterium sp. 319]KAB3528046.1 MFS transporter [Corynebacterium sp. 250]KAB3540465.1 MFS transporter [Corynebacterium sp. 366]